MAIDVISLTQIISDFRKLQSKDSVSPESLGAILQRIADLLATAGTSDNVTAIQTLLNSFKAAGQAVCSIKQGDDDSNNILAKIKAVNLGNGSIETASNNLFIKQATTERAGAMCAQQVVDLNNARNRIAEILPLLEKIQAKLGMTDGTKGLYNTAQIAVAVVNGTLRIYGAKKLIADGYVPYLFRHTSKRNRWGDKLVIEAGGPTKKHCEKRKGWNLYGSVHSVIIAGSTISFSTNHKHQQTSVATAYSTSPDALVSVHTRSDGTPSIGWGRSTISLLDPNNPKKHRMIRLRFAVGLAKKILPGRSLITTANLESSLAEFSIIYNPNIKQWTFGK